MDNKRKRNRIILAVVTGVGGVLGAVGYLQPEAVDSAVQAVGTLLNIFSTIEPSVQ